MGPLKLNHLFYLRWISLFISPGLQWRVSSDTDAKEESDAMTQRPYTFVWPNYGSVITRASEALHVKKVIGQTVIHWRTRKRNAEERLSACRASCRPDLRDGINCREASHA